MFARIVEFTPKLEKKEELVKVIRNDVLPILKKQTGFMEILPFFPETKNEKVVVVSLWMEQRNAERYEREAFPKVEEILQPYLTTPITFKSYRSRPPCVSISCKRWPPKRSRAAHRPSRSGTHLLRLFVFPGGRWSTRDDRAED